MLTVDELAAGAAKMTGPPGWTIKVGLDHWGLPEVRFQATVADARHPGRSVTLDIASPIPDIICDEATWAGWLHWRFGVIALHEIDEYVTYNGAPLHDPHAKPTGAESGAACEAGPA